MSTPLRLLAFVAVLGGVLLAGLGLGNAVGPVAGTAAEPHARAGTAAAREDDGDDGPDPGARTLSGLAVSDDGYTLEPAQTTLPQGTTPFSFTVTGADGAAVTDYDPTHERDLHLIVVRRDGSGFQHLHPRMSPSGTWQVPLTLDRPGAYRAYADFAPAGQPARTLAVDLTIPGEYTPVPWPAPAETATVDGLEVRLDGRLDAGEESELAFAVTRGGAPVELEPYLGARGHLVVLREGDLGYLHVHADGERLAFAATPPSSGRYRMYLQVQVDGVVRTVDLTTTAEGGHA